ncbi:MAG: SHOCT domain-containing protein [Candidatus Promineifilaceae bacterium]|nr:SHOCT domain-containing protein [Candidatus Promineifilaceae bacterium]
MEVNEAMLWGNHMGFGGWSLLLNGLLWIGLIIVGVWMLARLFPATGDRQQQGNGVERQDGPAETTSDTALQILQRRYARGELTQEEYETIRGDLSV